MSCMDFYIRNLIKYSRKNYVVPFGVNKEMLWIQELLEKNLSDIRVFNGMKILDIGCKNWVYAEGEWTFFKKFGKKFELDGIELDAYRLNTGYYSRLEVAKGYIKHFEEATYIVKDFLKHEEKYDVMIWILPFVFYEPQKAWGLPKKYFKPEQMLKHAYSKLNTGGIMLVVNQGEEEFEEQKRLYDKLNIMFEYRGEFKSDNDIYKKARFVSVVKK